MEPGTTLFCNGKECFPAMREYIVLRHQPLYHSKMVDLDFKININIFFRIPLCHNTTHFLAEVRRV